MSLSFPTSATYSGTNSWIMGLFWGGRWGPTSDPTIVEYSFMSGADPYSINGWDGAEWLDIEMSAMRAAHATWEAVANIDFVEANDIADADIWYWLGTSGQVDALGWHEVPDGSWSEPLYGAFANNTSGWTSGGLQAGGFGFVTLIHELGHGIGLAHPHDKGGDSIKFPGVSFAFGDYGAHDLNQGIFTTMSYNDGWESEYPSHSNKTYGWQATPMAFDVATVQLLYGANTSYRTGDDIYLLPDSNGGGTYWSCIWDAGGTDTLSAAGSSRDFTIDLRDAPLTGENAGGYVSWSSGIVGGFTIANTVEIENATGGHGADQITGNELSNILRGNGGADRLDGGAGADALYGGTGADIFVCSFGYGLDVIHDFEESIDALLFLSASGEELEASDVTITANLDGYAQYSLSDGSGFLLDGIYLGGNTPATGVPLLLGDLIEGQELSVDVSDIADADGLGDFSYEWLRDGNPISGADQTTYVLTDSDVGSGISVRVSFFDGQGIGEVVVSAQSSPIENLNDAPTGLPSISGIFTTGFTVTVDVSDIADADGLGDFSYEWLRDGNPISGADQTTYVLTDSDIGPNFSVRVNYVDGFGTFEEIGSQPIHVGYPPAISGDTRLDLVEDGIDQVSGNLDIDDPEGLVTTFAAVSAGALLGDFGVFAFDEITGEWGYEKENGLPDLQALAAGEQLTDSLVVSSAMEDASITLEVVITGVNDAPYVGTPQESVHLLLGDALNLELPENLFIDVDASDDLTVSFHTADSIDLPDWMAFESGALLGAADETGIIHIFATGTDTSGASATTDFYVSVVEDHLANDQLYGSDGDDFLTDAFGNNYISAGNGSDVIISLTGSGLLSGGAGDDFIAGGFGDDFLEGGRGNDLLIGDLGGLYFYGDDLLIGGEGNDFLEGGRGSDIFVFAPGDGLDVIAQFEPNLDVFSESLAVAADFDVSDDKLDLSVFAYTDTTVAMGYFSQTVDGAVFEDAETWVLLYGVDLMLLDDSNLII